MSWRNLIPWRAKQVPVKQGSSADSHPVFQLQRQMDDLFDSFWRDFGLSRPLAADFGAVGRGFSPAIDISDKGEQLLVKAELPGMKAEDLNVELHEDHVLLKGEKRDETHREEDGLSYRECSYGSFRRLVSLPCGVKTDKAEAIFKDGVLSLTLDKVDQTATQGKKIEVQTG